MSDAKRCDICGEFYTYVNSQGKYGAVYIRDVAYGERNQRDLCPDCAEKVDELLDGINKDAREKYMKKIRDGGCK